MEKEILIERDKERQRETEKKKWRQRDRQKDRKRALDFLAWGQVHSKFISKSQSQQK
jgi:hypothetical protein